jgi:transposase
METSDSEVIMSAAHSDDLRIRVVEEVSTGRMSRRQAAAHFRVSAASAVRWVSLKAQSGGVSPRPRGGKSRSPLTPHTAWLLELVAKEPDLTLAELEQRILDGVGLKITEVSIRRFFKRHRISYKNSARLRADAARRGRSSRAVEARADQP